MIITRLRVSVKIIITMETQEGVSVVKFILT